MTQSADAPTPDPLPRGTSRRLVWIACAILTVAAAAYSLYSRDKPVDWGLFARTFAEVNPWIFTTALLLVLLTYAGRAVRWQVMLKPIQPHSSFTRILVATIIGFTAVVLFGRAGELVRPYLIASKEKVPFSSQLAAWFLERIYDLLSVLFLFGFALSQIQVTSSKLGPSMTWILQTGGHAVGVLGTVCLAFLILFGLFPQVVEQRLHGAVTILPDRIAYKVSGFIKSFVSGTSSTRSGLFVFQLVAYTFAEWLLIVGCFLLVFKSIPATQSLTLLDSLIVVGFVAFGSAVQIPGVGGGMQVATVLVLTELFSLPLETAAGVAILLWVAAFVAVVPFGLGLALHEGLQLRKLLQTDEMKPL